jgi:hypothetical protein
MTYTAESKIGFPKRQAGDEGGSAEEKALLMRPWNRKTTQKHRKMLFVSGGPVTRPQKVILYHESIRKRTRFGSYLDRCELAVGEELVVYVKPAEATRLLNLEGLLLLLLLLLMLLMLLLLQQLLVIVLIKVAQRFCKPIKCFELPLSCTAEHGQRSRDCSGAPARTWPKCYNNTVREGHDVPARFAPVGQDAVQGSATNAEEMGRALKRIVIHVEHNSW